MIKCVEYRSVLQMLVNSPIKHKYQSIQSHLFQINANHPHIDSHEKK